MTLHRSELAAAVVAGGTSSRFGGAPKGLERVGGRRILDRVVEAASAIADRLLLISNHDEAERWLTGVRVVRDIRPERGSVVGIHTALAASGVRTLVLAWDMPFVSRALLELIVERGAGEPFAVVPEGTSGLEPFCALYTPASLPFVERAIDGGDLRATSLPLRFPSFTRVPRSAIAALDDPSRLFFNVNSAADLATAEAMDRDQRSRRQ